MNFPAYKALVVTACLLTVVATSCKKFLASYSQNKSFIETAADLDELLVGESYELVTNGSPQFFHIMDDDAEMGRPEGAFTDLPFIGFYCWQPDPRRNSEGKISTTDLTFNEIYRHIASLNVILYNAPLLRDKGQPADTLRRIEGEAHFLRGLYYFMLANLYGQPFRKSTAGTDYSVPLKTVSQIEDKFYSRSTVQQVYDQIVSDLLDAGKELEGFNEGTPKRANQTAAELLLSRVYLFMEDYENAVSFANKVIGKRRYAIANLNNYAQQEFASQTSPETIFTMGRPIVPFMMAIESESPVTEFYRVSGDLASMYDSKDLRLNAFFIHTTKGYMKCAKTRTANPTDRSVSDYWWLRMPEAWLNKAEALAMMGRDAEAIDAVQELRKNRFQPGDLTAINSGGEELISFIRDERRRELCFETHRWFDLRRYGVNERYPFGKLIRHSAFAYSGNGFVPVGHYELKPYNQDKAAYVVPIARDELEFNNGALTNEPRPDRPLIP